MAPKGQIHCKIKRYTTCLSERVCALDYKTVHTAGAECITPFNCMALTVPRRSSRVRAQEDFVYRLHIQVIIRVMTINNLPHRYYLPKRKACVCVCVQSSEQLAKEERTLKCTSRNCFRSGSIITRAKSRQRVHENRLSFYTAIKCS